MTKASTRATPHNRTQRESPSPVAPQPGTEMPPPSPCPATLELLNRRRSALAANMTGPGPSAAELRTLLGLASRVPDHGKLAPWRFIVIKGSARKRLGDVLGQAFTRTHPNAAPSILTAERKRFLRAPVVVTVVSRAVQNHKIPVWEQHLSAGAVCQTLLIAAHALGFAAQWLTEWYAYDDTVKSALGLSPEERIAGFIYLGQSTKPSLERVRPDLSSLIQFWRGGDAP